MRSTHQDAVPLTKMRKNAFAGAIGNVVEWYDFAAYAHMAPYISQLFFPSDDPFTSLLATYGVFATGYLSRPVGALIFGHIGDKVSRKLVLLLSVSLMGIATAAIGFLPVHSQIGASAAAVLVLLRILQGLSVGGEYTGSTTFVVEYAPSNRRAFYTSWIPCGAAAGFLLGSATATVLANLLDEAEILNWAWRIPFLLGGVIGLLAVLLRSGIAEPPAPEYQEALQRSPVLVALTDHWRDILKVMGLALSASVGFYLVFVYALTYLITRMHVSTASAMDINTLCVLVLTVLPLPIAMLSDRIGRKPILLTGTLGLLLLSWPLFWLMHHHDVTLILIGQLGFAILFSWLNGAVSATMAEILPRRVRVSVLSIGYNACLSVFGGTTPLVATYLVERTADDFAPVYYLMALSVLSLVAVLSIPETNGKPLKP